MGLDERFSARLQKLYQALQKVMSAAATSVKLITAETYDFSSNAEAVPKHIFRADNNNNTNKSKLPFGQKDQFNPQ